METENTGNQPEKRFSTGVISATVWKNQGKSKKGEPVEYRTITLQRRYQDKENNWQSTNSLRVNDLPKASLVLQKAYEFIVLKNNGSSASYNTVEGEEVI